MRSRRRRGMLDGMPSFMLDHRHTAAECGAVFAAFNAFDSALRHRPTLASCHFGGHQIWWRVDAATEDEALARLPYYVAKRTTAIRVRTVEIP
jgi:hypothetical protein